jgi:hypothetical protein
MASQFPAVKNTAFNLYWSNYKTDYTILDSSAGAFTKKRSIDGGAIADVSGTITEISGTYGLYKCALTTGDMNGDAIWLYFKSSETGAMAYTTTIYTAAQTMDTISTNVIAAHTDASAANTAAIAAHTDASAAHVDASAAKISFTSYNLDHLCAVATAGVDMTAEVVDGSILSRIISNSDTSLFVPSTSNLTTAFSAIHTDASAAHVDASAANVAAVAAHTDASAAHVDASAAHVDASAAKTNFTTYNLDHLAGVTTASADMTAECVDGSILSRIISNSDTSLFVPSTSNLTTAFSAIHTDASAAHVDASAANVAAIAAHTDASAANTNATAAHTDASATLIKATNIEQDASATRLVVENGTYGNSALNTTLTAIHTDASAAHVDASAANVAAVAAHTDASAAKVAAQALPSGTAIADFVWDEVKTGHTTLDSYGKFSDWPVVATKADSSATLIKVTNIEQDASAANSSIGLLRKLLTNKMVESEDGTTITVYQDDGSGTLGTFTWSDAEKMRTKFTGS